ncbi:MAG: NAD(P)/FAD-dependent oxidoreductase [Candidatus Bathyarchaeia archaeon]
MEKFDVIVVGAGTGGCMAAKATAKAGLKVCLIDRKRKEDIGDKVCGDAIGSHHFDSLGLDYPTGDELEHKIVGAKIYSPDGRVVFHVEMEDFHGFIVNRRLFGQRLLKDAVDAGSTLLDSVQVTEPVIKNGFVTGVSARDLKSGGKIELYGEVVVDASGYSAVLRRKLPLEMGVDVEIDEEDVVICYREIRGLKEELTEPDFGELYVSRTIAPGGYAWVFPESHKKVNVGLGVAMVEGFPNPKKLLYDHILSRPQFEGSTLVTGGGGHDPSRRSLDCMTGNGMLIVGDAACQVNPIHGGGMGPSMIGGTLAAKAIIRALEEGSVSREELWSYNVEYMRSYGAKQAGLDVFRMFLQGLSDEDLNYGMKYRLITEEDVLKASMVGEVRVNITEATRRVFRALRKLGFLKRLRDAAKLIKEAKALYQQYPASAEGFEEWKGNAQDLIRKAELKFKKSPGMDD